MSAVAGGRLGKIEAGIQACYNDPVSHNSSISSIVTVIVKVLGAT